METTIVEERVRRRRIGVAGVVGIAGAIAFAVASVWYALAINGVTVVREPVFTGDEGNAERYRIFYGWVVMTLAQERLYVSVAILGFVCLAAVAALAYRSMGADRPLARVGAFVLGLGASLWIVGNVVQLGGHRAVGLMTTHGNPLPDVGAIYFTIEMIDDAFETAAFAAVGVGMLALAWVGLRAGARGWGWFTGAVGLISLMLSAAYLADEGDAVNALLLALGAAIVPVWLAWTSSRLAPVVDAGAH